MSTKVAVIQKPPVLLNKQATIDRALTSIDEAVDRRPLEPVRFFE